MPSLDSDVVTGAGFSETVSAQDIIEYSLLCAMANIALSRWSAAMRHLEFAVCQPARNAPSAMMVEAYKKWLLVGLLRSEKVKQVHETCLNFGSLLFISDPVNPTWCRWQRSQIAERDGESVRGGGGGIQGSRLLAPGGRSGRGIADLVRGERQFTVEL